VLISLLPLFSFFFLFFRGCGQFCLSLFFSSLLDLCRGRRLGNGVKPTMVGRLLSSSFLFFLKFLSLSFSSRVEVGEGGEFADVDWAVLFPPLFPSPASSSLLHLPLRGDSFCGSIGEVVFFYRFGLLLVLLPLFSSFFLFIPSSGV